MFWMASKVAGARESTEWVTKEERKERIIPPPFPGSDRDRVPKLSQLSRAKLRQKEKKEEKELLLYTSWGQAQRTNKVFNHATIH